MSNVKPEEQQPLDLARERKAASFDVDAASCVFAGSRQVRDRHRWLLSLLRDDAEGSFDKTQRAFMGRYERFMHAQGVARRYFELRNRHGLAKEDRDRLRLYLDEYIPLQVHESMGHPTLESQSSEEQWKEWGHSVASGRWLVCYAQTELAHGSNLSGLRTTATLDKTRDVFIIHTPEASAGKVWIGGAGVTANHAIVMANLIIDGKAFGMHPFLVPMRDTETHRLLPGVDAIDMGPKVGANAMDNGYITFGKVEIPRGNLLARYQVVHPDGRYEQRNKEGKALTRGAMTLVRVGLVEIAAHHAARATLIAIRYALVRRQGSSSLKGGIEPQILDYPGLQARLFSCLSTAWALTLTGLQMRSLYNEMQAQIKQGETGLLGTVHGVSSILKACASNEGLAAIEVARRSMGGHGYSAASGLADLERNQPTANLTYEGDNNMLLGGPAANFLVKQLTNLKGTPRPELTFLSAYSHSNTCSARTSSDFLSADVQLSLVSYRAGRLVRELHSLRAKPVSNASTQAYLDAALAARASRAAGAYLITYAFITKLAEAEASTTLGTTVSPQLKAALSRLRSFYVLDVCVNKELGEYEGYLSREQVQMIRETLAVLAQVIRPDALALAEAFDMDDWYLGSALGHSSGRAYDEMLTFMRQEPLNASGEHGGRDEHGVVKGFRNEMGRLTHGEGQGWVEQKRGSKL